MSPPILNHTASLTLRNNCFWSVRGAVLYDNSGYIALLKWLFSNAKRLVLLCCILHILSVNRVICCVLIR